MNKFLTALSLFVSLILLNSCYSTNQKPVEKAAIIRGSNISPALKKASAKVDSFFQNRSKRGLFNGSVLFGSEGKIIYENAFGYANFKKKEKLKISSSFQLASLTKPITSYAILRLIQEGKLALTDTLGRFIKNFPYKGITLHLLLAHRSGLPEYMYFADKYWKNKKIPITNKDVIDLMKKYKPLRYYKPDHRYNYSNTNYVILAYIIEKVTGKTYKDFMKESVFNPLQMTHTFVYQKEKGKRNTAEVIGYIRQRRKADDTYLNGVVGDKGIYSSVEDLFKWSKVIDNGKFVSDSLMKKAFTPQHKDLRIYDNYGYGWRINASDSTNKIVYHTGWWKGFRSYFIKELGEKNTIVVLSNISKAGILGSKELISLISK